MGIIIKRLFELSDDLQNIMICDLPSNAKYHEVYARKIVFNGIARQAFTLRAKTFYEITLSHIQEGADFILSPKLSRVGLMYTYNKQTRQLFIYNCTQNQIYIEENENIGDVYDG